MTLPASAAEAERRAAAPLLPSVGACCTAPAARPQLSIDISRPQGAQQQTRRTPPLPSTVGTQTTDVKNVQIKINKNIKKRKKRDKNKNVYKRNEKRYLFLV